MSVMVSVTLLMAIVVSMRVRARLFPAFDAYSRMIGFDGAGCFDRIRYRRRLTMRSVGMCIRHTGAKHQQKYCKQRFHIVSNSYDLVTNNAYTGQWVDKDRNKDVSGFVANSDQAQNDQIQPSSSSSDVCVYRGCSANRCARRQAGGFDCRVANHVVAGNSHVVVDIERCDVSILAIAGIHSAVAQIYPGYEMKEIDFVIVEDGGAWSSVSYGYKVRLNEPPNFKGGPIRRFAQRCADSVCAWHDVGSAGTWSGGSTYVQNLRRERKDPLIEHFAP